MLESFLFKIKDHRRKQGRRYQLGHILLFTVLAISSNASSYRKVHVFIKCNYEILDKTFGLNWKRVPAYTTIRDIIQGTSPDELEKIFREYSQFLAGSNTEKWQYRKSHYGTWVEGRAFQRWSSFLSCISDCRTERV